MKSKMERLKIACFFILLFMILSRLVWVQLRQYSPDKTEKNLALLNWLSQSEISACHQTHFPAPALNEETLLSQPSTHLPATVILFYDLLCKRKQNRFNTAVTVINRNIYFLLVFFAVFLIRFTTSSWLLALFTATMLLSRGALLTELGSMQTNHLLSACLMLWMTCLVHFMKTGSLITLTLAIISNILAGLFDQLFIFQFLFIPIALSSGYLLHAKVNTTIWQKHKFLILQRINRALAPQKAVIKKIMSNMTTIIEGQSNLEAKISYSPRQTNKISLFSTLSIPFSTWIFSNKRWIKLSIWFLFIFFSIFYFELYLEHSITQLFQFRIPYQSLPQHRWVTLQLLPFDLHYGICFSLIIANLLHSPSRGLSEFFEFSWLIVFNFLFLLCLSYWLGVKIDRNFHLLSNLQVVRWFEPVILTFGMAAFYNLIRIAENRRNRHSNLDTLQSYGSTIS